MAGMAGPTIGQTTSREIKRVLSEARWSVSEAARRLGVDRRTVHRWLKGEKVDLDDLSRLAEMTGKPIVIRLGHKETPAPEWAQGLAEDVGAIRQVVESNAEELAALRAVLEAIPGLLGPDGDDPVDVPSPQPRAGRRGR